MTKNEGTRSKENTVAAIIPPTTAFPTAWRLAAPAPLAIRSGRKPRMEENAVIKIARKRSRAASTAESVMDIPSLRFSEANSTIRIAFLLASATNRTIPI